MALSSVSYTADGATQIFSVPFLYIEKTHIKVYDAGVEKTTFTWPTDSTIDLGYMPTNGNTVLIERNTPTDARLVDFQDGATLDEANLDKDSEQNFYNTQEIVDDLDDKLGLDLTDDKYDANSKNIKDLADPVNAQDAVTKNHLDTTFTTALNQAVTDAETAETGAQAAETAALAAQTAAELAKTNAETAKTNAETAETNAAASESLAAEWAEKAEDSAITGYPGQFSALHHSAKAAAALSTALRTQTAAEYTKQINFNQTALSISTGNVAWDADDNVVTQLTLTENVTMLAPTNLNAGSTLILEVVQDVTGNRTMSWNAVFKWDGDITPDPVFTASKTTIFMFKSDGTNLFGAVFFKEE